MHNIPVLFAWSVPFFILLLAIALLPFVPRVSHWWERNRHKLLLSILLSVLICIFYALRSFGFEEQPPGAASLGLMLRHSVLEDYLPFIILLFSLYTISGGVRLKGDLPAHPMANVLILLSGSLLASLIGTTGAAMLLIRPLLQINSERKHVKHTVIFFIFLVCNIGGCLLPIGDPPLFLGYLRGVPFFWTLSHLFTPWLVCVLIVLAVYYVFEIIAYRHEDKESLRLDETKRLPLTLEGKRNIILLAVVLAAVAGLIPGRVLPWVHWKLPNLYLRELALLGLSGLSLLWTPGRIHKENHFNFHAIGEVACLFIGIFITMQAPIELLRWVGPGLGISRPVHFFWASGALSSFLDNAPTYAVFFEAASSLPVRPGTGLLNVLTVSGHIPTDLLRAVSLGAVFMGANTYIANGPNFLVKSIADHHGVRMPHFFGYMAYSGFILLPVFLLVSWIFF